MAYDPQARHRRPKPADDDPVPVDSLLGEPSAAESLGYGEPVSGGVPDDDPPPNPAVTPAPADPRSDRLLVSSGISSLIAAAAAAFVLRQLWKRWRRRPAAS